MSHASLGAEPEYEGNLEREGSETAALWAHLDSYSLLRYVILNLGMKQVSVILVANTGLRVEDRLGMKRGAQALRTNHLNEGKKGKGICLSRGGEAVELRSEWQASLSRGKRDRVEV